MLWNLSPYLLHPYVLTSYLTKESCSVFEHWSVYMVTQPLVCAELMGPSHTTSPPLVSACTRTVLLLD